MKPEPLTPASNFARLDAALTPLPKMIHTGTMNVGTVLNPATNITVPSNRWNAWSVASQTNPPS